MFDRTWVKMKFLVCNDDGINSAGLKAIAHRLCEKNEVTVIAPSVNKSACAHSLSLANNIVVKKILDKPYKAFAVEGTPVDCIKFAKIKFCGHKDDIVIAGINLAHNLGTDILYSGTVAIAYEASFFGSTCFAFSAPKETDRHMDKYAEYAEQIINNLLPVSDYGDIWNINFPDLNCCKIVGVKITKLGKQIYSDDYVLVGENTYKLTGLPLDHAENDVDCDVEWIKKGYITITPLLFDKTNYKNLKKVKKLCIKLL